jgi:hypothetical protein
LKFSGSNRVKKLSTHVPIEIVSSIVTLAFDIVLVMSKTLCLRGPCEIEVDAFRCFVRWAFSFVQL